MLADLNDETSPESALRISDPLQLRERLLAAAARASRVLLEATDAMSAMPEVLRFLGEAADVDRTVLALEPSDSGGLHSLCAVSEWLAEGVSSPAEGAARFECGAGDDECVYAELRAGRTVTLDAGSHASCSIAGEQAKGAVIVPIQVAGEYHGVIGFDDYRQCRRFEPAVVSALEIAAGVLGAALHRQKLLEAVQRERERAVEERVAELARANAAIRGSLERLAGKPDLSSFVGDVLLEATRLVNAAAGTITVAHETKAEWHVMAHVHHGLLTSPPFADSVPFDQTEIDPLFRESPDPIDLDIEYGDNCPWPGALEYHRAHGHRRLYVRPLVFGKSNVGFIVLAFVDGNSIDVRQSELLVAMAQQATLAVELTRLASSARQAAVLGERNRISQEIHDGLAQGFTGILMQLGAAEELHGFSRSSPLAPILQRVKDLAREGLAEARRSVLALRPLPSRDKGLEHALRQLAERSTISGRTVCTFDGAAATGLAPEHEHDLLRIAQEAVSNAVRHGRPRTIRISISEYDERWTLTIADDGIGMQLPPERCARRGFGLTNMRERAEAIGAEWIIESQAGTGTRVRVQLPRRVAA